MPIRTTFAQPILISFSINTAKTCTAFIAKLGLIPRRLRRGISFESGNVDALSHQLATVVGMKKEAIAEMGIAARTKVEKEYNADLHYNRLMTLYQRATTDPI